MSAEHEDRHDEVAEDTPIIDCDVLEAAKENIQPLARGRRVTALSAILSTPHAHRESRLAATRNRLKMNVQLALENTADEDEDEDEDSADPLDAYCQFVYWVVENYPQGHSAESGLLELLEEATRVLKDHQGGKYRDDIRYLKLWVLYASYVEKPAVVFKFCLVNEIGTSHALLYEEFAVALERSGRKSEADEAYLLGIARRAGPLERLESKHREFQKRMMASPTLPVVSPSEPTVTTPDVAPKTRRAVLGDAGSSSSRSTRSTRSSARLQASATPTLPATSSRPASNSRLQVFVDASLEASASPSNPEEDQASAWPEFGTRKSRIKENVKEATKAQGTTLKQSGKSRRVASGNTPTIPIFRDPPMDEHGNEVESAEARPAAAAPPPASRKGANSIAVLCDDPSVAEARSSQKKPSSSKSSMPIFRDQESASSSEKTKVPKGKALSKPKATMSIFQDEDKPPNPAAAPIKSKSTSKAGSIAVFCDEENDPAVEPLPATTKARGTSKAGLSIFQDDSSGGAPALKPAKASTAGKSKLLVFKDEEPEGGSTSAPPGPQPHVTPAFKPFRDDDMSDTEVVEPALTKGKSVGLGLGILAPQTGAASKLGGGASIKMSSEAEALRKDPLKNYAEHEKVMDGEGDV